MIGGDPAPAASPPATVSPTPANILGVDYWHVKTGDAGDLYLTRHGLPILEHLLPSSWYERAWFEQNRQRLEGTSTVYRIGTREVNGRRLELVVKWCRVGEEVPFDTVTLNKFAEAEFNSPYEEFALVHELRGAGPRPAVRTHRPLAIYVPAERLQLWQTGRVRSKMAAKKAKHRDIELDVFRHYILVYEWIKGLSVPEALASQPEASTAERDAVVTHMMHEATDNLARHGFRVLDMKPAHIIVRQRTDRSILRRGDGRIPYALVDFELLERTPEREREVTRARRSAYLKRQRDRFDQGGPAIFPPHLHPLKAVGVDYVAGHTESTRGTLWVVGRDPGLFDYFQPERWRRTPRTRLSETNEVYYTKTKDVINVVWKVSRVGEQPDADAASPAGAAIIAHGYNSPFEEFAAAFRLGRAGIATVYPRAIYMTGLESDRPEYVEDNRRYPTHDRWRDPEGHPALRPDHLYITIWGFWNGLDEMLATRDADYCRGINLGQAVCAGYVSRAEADDLLAQVRDRLAAAGAEDLNLKGDHVLLSLTPGGILIRDTDGRPDMRLCNFELMRMAGLGGGP